MTNALTIPGANGLISREDLAKSLNNAAMSMPSVGNGGKAFLKMDKNNGDWIFGQEETVVEEDSLWAVDPTSLKHGLVAWDSNAGGAPIQEFMVPINRNVPDISSLPELPMSKPDKKGNSYQLTYQPQRSVDLVCIRGEDEGTAVEYKQSSTGAMKLFGKLTNDLLAQVSKGDEIVAVVKLTFESYKNKTYGGTTFNPIFETKEWRTMADVSPAGGDAAEGKDDAADEGDQSDDAADEEAKLAAEYEAEQKKAAPAASEDSAPRRRLRR